MQLRAAGLLLWARRAEDIDRLLHCQRPAARRRSSKGEQCHASSRRRRLNTNWFTLRRGETFPLSLAEY